MGVERDIRGETLGIEQTRDESGPLESHIFIMQMISCQGPARQHSGRLLDLIHTNL